MFPITKCSYFYALPIVHKISKHACIIEKRPYFESKVAFEDSYARQ